MKSVIRSSILLGSRTKVGKVTLERSMPTLDGQGGVVVVVVSRRFSSEVHGVGTHRSCEMSDRMIEPSSSSLWELIVSTVVDIQYRGRWGRGDRQDGGIVRIRVLRHFVIGGRGRPAWPAFSEKAHHIEEADWVQNGVSRSKRTILMAL